MFVVHPIVTEGIFKSFFMKIWGKQTEFLNKISLSQNRSYLNLSFNETTVHVLILFFFNVDMHLNFLGSIVQQVLENSLEEMRENIFSLPKIIQSKVAATNFLASL